MIQLAFLLVTLARPGVEGGQDAPAESKRVLVVINKASQDSIAIGAYYVQKRKIPKVNVVMIECGTTDTITVDEYKSKVQPPVQAGIKACKNPIDFIVTTKGVPIRLRDDGGWSLDGHLGAMNVGLTPMQGLNDSNADAQISKSLNPYYKSKDHFSSAKFKGLYLVCRLDGYTLDDCKRLVDNALLAKPDKGPFFMNGAGGRSGGGYGDMQEGLIKADALLKQRGFDCSYEDKKFRAPGYALMGYASWGSNDGTFNLDEYKKLRFKPGAIVETFVSTSARTFKPTTGGQSLIADLIAQGVTGVKGYVSEPFTFALANPEILFDRYTSGFNLAESFYAASLLASWKDLVVGDPLCNPYAKP